MFDADAEEVPRIPRCISKTDVGAFAINVNITVGTPFSFSSPSIFVPEFIRRTPYEFDETELSIV